MPERAAGNSYRKAPSGNGWRFFRFIDEMVLSAVFSEIFRYTVLKGYQYLMCNLPHACELGPPAWRFYSTIPVKFPA
ncbi:hypothetical protein BCO9919_07574 [Burkholderia cenocepacia]|uniref:Uncharacterized protein n=1 Tax=Burkholderia cenocepacia TaxID=95486 RepID=A0A6J5JXH0_9BURK|nr:hypothetical protein BCO9919_07574 [Burkholderia cenocepacia]